MSLPGSARLWALLAIASLAGIARSARAEAPSIAHDGIGCIQTDQFPKIHAKIEPEELAANVRAYFRAQGTPHWYFTPLKESNGGFEGALPKPRKGIAGIEYYIEVTAKDMATARTAAFEPRVVSTAAACEGKLLAPVLASAKVIVGAPAAGSPPIPAGFSSAGVVSAGATATVGATTAAAGAGISGVTVGILAGVGALGAGVAVAAAGSSSSSSEETADPCAGGFDFTMDFAYAGTVSSVMNPRQQAYRVHNAAGAPLRIEGIEAAFSFTCNGSSNSFTLPLAHLVENAPPRTTTIIRAGAPAGTGRLICCSGAFCPTSTFVCSYSQQYTVRTGCGARTLPHSFNLTFTGDLPSCASTSGEWY
jgi:hypothetical protein